MTGYGLYGPSSPAVVSAMEMTFLELARNAIPRLLVGRLAVSARGVLRATDNVDILVPPMWRRVFDIGTFFGPVEMIAYRVIGVRVNLWVADELAARAFPPMDEEPARPYARIPSPEVFVAPVWCLAYMKLRLGRPHDRQDVRDLMAREDVSAIGEIKKMLPDSMVEELERLAHAEPRESKKIPPDDVEIFACMDDEETE